MCFVVGVDGGGSKTAAAVVGDDLSVLGRSVAGPANSRSVGIEASGQNILQAVTQALCAADVPLERVEAICLCLAGFDTELDTTVPQRAIALLGFEGPAIFENDVVGAWAGVTGGEAGIVAIAGAGATALGMNARGEFWRTDGWDYVLGDAGSGYRIGQEGIYEAMKMLDGRRPPTRLLSKLAECYGVDDALGMRRLADSGALGKLHTAEFARFVGAAAEEGDSVAQGILQCAARDIASDIEAIITRLGMEDDVFPVGVVGGVFKSSAWTLEPLRAAVARLAPHATVVAPYYPPEVGAAIVAQRRLAEGDRSSWTLGGGKRHIQRSLQVSQLALS